jgi:hypothetical protein
MSFFYEGNGFFTDSHFKGTIGNSSIKTSSIDMLDTIGNYQTITNHEYPTNEHDVAIKGYVDVLGTTNVFTLNSTVNSLLKSDQNGSFLITIRPIIVGGPSGIFNITKNDASNYAQINRIAMTPSNDLNGLRISWPISDGIYINKLLSTFDGQYFIKII